MWFKVCGKLIRFSLGEFGLLSGLNVFGDIDRGGIKNSNPIGLYSKFFGDHTRGISRIIVEERFKAANFDNDDEAVRMAVLYLITNFLYAWQKEKNIEKTDLYLCDSGGFNHFPWGKDIFNVTLSSLRDALRENEVVITRQGSYPTYKLNGLPFVFQVFIYESIPSLEGTYCEKVSCGLPRIINWSSVAIPSHKELERNVFSLHKTKIVKVLPTDEENNAFKLEGFFQCNKDMNVADFEDDDFVAPPKKPTSEAPSSSYVPCVTFGFSDMKIIVDECQKKCNIMSKEIAFLKSASESRHRALMEMLVNLKNDQDLKHKAVMEMLGELRPKSCGINDDIDHVDVGFVGADVGDTSGGGGVSKEKDKFFENESFTQVFDECIQAMQEDAAGDMVIADDKNDTVNENEKTTGNDVEETMNIVKPHDDVADVVKDLEEEAHIFNNMNVEIFDKVVHAAVGDLAKKKEVIMATPIAGSLMNPVVVSTPVVGKRNPKPATVLQSPFVNQFGSSSSKDMKHLEVVKSKRKVVGRYAFGDNLFDLPNQIDQDSFNKWFSLGLRKNNKYKKFDDNNSIIKEPFQFCVTEIERKIWFYDLVKDGRDLDNEHINVAFYYLRKKAKYCELINVRVTTTDNSFDQVITSLYDVYLSSDCDRSVISHNSVIFEYICGYKMLCNTPWSLVDFILFPINMTVVGCNHWILGEFNVKQRFFKVYNSMRNRVMDKKVLKVVEAYSTLLPLFLSLNNFYESREDIDLNAQAFKGIDMCHPLDIVFDDEVPQQSNNDCGIFIIKFAEFLMHGLIENIPNPLNVSFQRNKIAVELYVHAKRKKDEGYLSDGEFRGRMSKKMLNVNAMEV
ncbi:uncharacterized protein LOC133808562 [Humulus lupulus]|nr:uncharacterized protein LOC133781603 [Humulus lupulus]XP_062101863.1 uncharacterized protein LOC133808562 [Humulus lupulus]